MLCLFVFLLWDSWEENLTPPPPSHNVINKCLFFFKLNAESEVTFISDHRWMGVQAKWRYMRETQTLAWCMRNATRVTIFKFYNISWWKRCSAIHFANRAGHFTIVKFRPPITSEPVSLTSLAESFWVLVVFFLSWFHFWYRFTFWPVVWSSCTFYREMLQQQTGCVAL